MSQKNIERCTQNSAPNFNCAVLLNPSVFQSCIFILFNWNKIFPKNLLFTGCKWSGIYLQGIFLFVQLLSPEVCRVYTRAPITECWPGQDSKPSQMNWKIRELVSILCLWPSGDQHRTSFNGTDNNFNAIKPPISPSTSKAEFTIKERWNPRGEGMRCGTDRNIRCKLYPQRFILVLSGTLPVIQQMSSTTHEILITIRFSSTKHPALIHMDMIYTWHSPSPSKLYHFRLRLRRVISWVTRPRGPAVARFYDTIIFTARVLQYFLRNYVRYLP